MKTLRIYADFLFMVLVMLAAITPYRDVSRFLLALALIMFLADLLLPESDGQGS